MIIFDFQVENCYQYLLIQLILILFQILDI